jgi:hypothetical protein
MEKVMKTVVMALAGVVFAAVPALAANICIDARNVVSSKSTDGKTMVFKMKDGSTMVNHLQGSCPDLKFNGFVWDLRSGDTQVCENAQSLRVLRSLQVCTLGKFDAPMMQKQAAN